MKRGTARAKVTRWAATATTGTISPMNCRPGCAACCTAPSISSPLPGYPEGKPAGVPCPFLDDTLRCTLFGLPERPRVCSSLQPEPDMCGDSREQAMRWLTKLEIDTGLDAGASDWPHRQD